MTYGLVALLAPFVVGLPLMTWGAKKFGERRRREGAWDDDGPLHPTEPPLAFLKPRSSIGHLETLREELERPEVRPSKRRHPPTP